MRPSLAALVPLVCLLTTTPAVLASEGDHSAAYSSCIAACLDPPTSPSPPLPFHLRLLLWDTPSNCRYLCQQHLTTLSHALAPPDIHTIYADLRRQGKAHWGWYDHAKLAGLPLGKTVQYHGKWPFRRIGGMQEPASVLFSLLNLVPHLIYLPRLHRRLPSDLPFRTAYLGITLANINAWIWSAVFHTRDFALTEKLDYFSAALVILISVYAALVRVLRLWSPSTSARTRTEPTIFSQSESGDDGLILRGRLRRTTLRRALKSTSILLFLSHISYLSLWKFDYTYNMVFSILLGLVHNALWYLWGFQHFFTSSASSKRAPRWYFPPLMVTVLSALMCLEVFDFPPWERLVDAHALWHAGTAPLVGIWYEWLIEDARWLMKVEGEHGGWRGDEGKRKK